MSITERELIRRADLTLGDLASGGLLQPEVTNRFLRKMIEQPTVLNDVRFVPMARPQMEIHKIGFGSRVLRAATNSSHGALISSPRSGEEGTRALARADRSAPTTSKISLETKEVIAEVNIPYEVFEDNIEGGGIDGTQFQQTVLALLSEQVAKDLEELLLNGNTITGDDAYMRLINGLLTQATSNIVNFNNQAIEPVLFSAMIKALPVKYHRLLDQMRFYLATVREIDYRMQVAQRQTGLGDAVLTGGAPVSVLGVQMKPASLMPVANMLLTIPRNVIFGVQRRIRMEFDRDVRERVIIIVLTMRLDFTYEEEDMVVKAINIGGAA